MAYRVREEAERDALLARIAQESQRLGLEFRVRPVTLLDACTLYPALAPS